jgi:hypothetical protein
MNDIGLILGVRVECTFIKKIILLHEFKLPTLCHVLKCNSIIVSLYCMQSGQKIRAVSKKSLTCIT